MKLFLNENSNIENYSVPSKKQPIDEIDDIANSISDNISKEIKIPANVLDSFAIKPELNKQLWQNDKLNSEVRTKLIKIADDFFKELNLPSEVKMKDIIFTGSLANFNWSEYSDIDMHIVLDFSQIEAEDKFKEDFFYAQKALWNQAHDITVFKYPVELYVQDIKAKLVASAVYSVKKDKWILQPKREEFKVNKKVIKQKADRFIDNLKDIKKDYQENKLQSVVDKVQKLKDKIKNYRTSGLEKGGEYAIENLVFKTLRRTPFMDILDSYKAKAYDKLMSVKETIKESLKTLTEAIVKATEADLYRTMFLVTKANALYGPNSELTDDFDENTRTYLNSPNMGQGNIIYKVNERGLPYIWNSPYSGADISKNDLGSRGSNQVHKQFGIKVMPGIEHPEDNQERTGDAATRKGLTGSEKKEVFTFNLPDGVVTSKGKNFLNVKLDKPGSPASDGVIKLYLLYGQEIIDYVRTYVDGYNAYTAHDDAADIAQQKTADKNQYKFGKKGKEDAMAANVEKDRNLVDPSKETGAEIKARKDAEREKKRQQLRAKRNSI